MIAVLLFAACGTDPTPAAVSNPASSAASNVESGPVARPAEVMERGRQNSAVPVGSTDLRPVPASCPDGMLGVPGGRFVMGQATGDAGSDERVVHLVMVDGFCMDRTEVAKPGTERPWVGLSWQEAQAACEARNARLPTEAEWEKAARGGCETGGDPLTCDAPDARLYPWGDQSPNCTLANHSVVGPRGPKRCADGPGPVQGVAAGAGPYGHLQLAGNVWEYVLDAYHPGVYRTDRPENPMGPSTARSRVLRGGAWDTFSTNMRVSNRFNDHLKGSTIGFRCVQSDAKLAVEDIAPVEWHSVPVQVRQRSGSSVDGRWLVVTAFDVSDVDVRTGLPYPGRSPLAETGMVPNGTQQMEIPIEVPMGSNVRFSAALDVGGSTPTGRPAASSGGIGWAQGNHVVGKTPGGVTVELAPLPAHPHSPRP